LAASFYAPTTSQLEAAFDWRTLAPDHALPAGRPQSRGWADIRALRGQELDKAQQIAQKVEHVISIAYQIGVNQAMLVGFENRSFLIEYIEDEDERHIFLDLYCAEIGQNAGSQS